MSAQQKTQCTQIKHRSRQKPKLWVHPTHTREPSGVCTSDVTQHTKVVPPSHTCVWIWFHTRNLACWGHSKSLRISWPLTLCRCQAIFEDQSPEEAAESGRVCHVLSSRPAARLRQQSPLPISLQPKHQAHSFLQKFSAWMFGGRDQQWTMQQMDSILILRFFLSTTTPTF